MNLKIIKVILVLSIILTLVQGCSLCKKPIASKPPGPEVIKPSNDTLDLVKALHKNATNEALLKELDPILLSINRSKRQDLSSVLLALRLLSEQPNVVSALSHYYHGLDKQDFSKRILTVKVLGALRRNDSLPILRSIVLEPGNQEGESPKYQLGKRNYDDIVRSRAIRGITYLRTSEALKETIHVIKTHPSRAVRIEAIEAYMWNLGDSEAAAATLYRVAPEVLRRYITRPRFYRGMDPTEFDIRVQKWRTRWVTQADPDSPIRTDITPTPRVGASKVPGDTRNINRSTSGDEK